MVACKLNFLGYSTRPVGFFSYHFAVLHEAYNSALWVADEVHVVEDILELAMLAGSCVCCV